MARPETAAGAGARRDRVRHLLRSARRRVLRRRRVPEGCGAAEPGVPTRLGRRHDALSGRPAHPRRRRHGGCAAAEARGRPGHPEDPGPADLLRRRREIPGVARGARRAGRLARRPRDHVPRGRDGCREGSSHGQVRLDAEARLRRRGDDARRRASGSVGAAGQPPRRLGVRRFRSAQRPCRDDGGGEGDRRPREERLEAQAHARVSELGRRGAVSDRLDGVGGDPRGRAEGQGAPLRQHRRERARLSGRRRQPLAPADGRQGGGRRRGSRNGRIRRHAPARAR